MPFELVLAEGAAGARSFRFDRREVTIGRAPENDLVVHDPRASRVHARIRERGEGYAVLDDGSCNGTALNNRQVRGAARLRDGDRIRVGGTTLEFASRREPLALVRGREVLVAAAGAVRGWPLRLRAFALAAGAASFAVCVVVTVAAVAERGVAARPRPAPGNGGANDAGATVPDVPAPAELFLDGLGQLREVREPYDRGRRKLEERRIAPRNLYDSWRAFTAAATAIEATAPGATIPADLSRLIEWTQQELEMECRRLLIGAARSERYGQDGQVDAAYREILRHFPGDDASGCRRRARAVLAAVETPAPAGGVFGYPEAR